MGCPGTLTRTEVDQCLCGVEVLDADMVVVVVRQPPA